MVVNSEILDKIQKLLRLADCSRGATEHEAKIALAKAEELMVRHKIDSAMLRLEQDNPDEIKNDNIKLSKTLNPADKLILSIIQSQFDVRVILTRRIDHTQADIIGAAEDVQLATYAFGFLHETFISCWKEFRKIHANPDRKSYYRGLHDGLREAIAAGKRKAEAAYTQEQHGKYQIVVANTKIAIDHFIGEKYGKVRKSPNRSSRVHSESYRAGKNRGASIQINRPLSDARGCGN